MPLTAAELADIEQKLAELPAADRKALASRLAAAPRQRARSDIMADRLLTFLRQLRRRTDVLPSNRDIERLAGLDGEDISYLLKVLRRRHAVTVDFPRYGSTERTFELPW